MRSPVFEVRDGRMFVRAILPHVSDDEVGRGDEEVVDSLESCADGVMHLSHAGLRNYL